ncbi:MAG: helix-turn-helix transcriptional regulator [Pseudomonadota bacterium]
MTTEGDHTMQVRTAKDIGAAIRDARKKRDLDQAELAAKVGVGRQWISEVENGKPRAELGLVLKTLDALDLPLSIGESLASQTVETPDIDLVITSATGAKP